MTGPFNLTKRHRRTSMLCFVVVAFCLLFLAVAVPLASAQDGPTGENPQNSDTSGGIGTWLGNLVYDNTVGLALLWITKLFFTIAGWLAGVGAILLDLALKFTLDVDTFRLPAVQTGWSLFRDIANMSFIFILVYIAFSTILQLGGNYQRTLITLAIVAVLVNFSFFLTGIVIDAGNIFAAFLYNILTDNGALGIGTQFKNALDIPHLLDSSSLENIDNTQIAVFYLLGAVVLLIAGFTFLAAAILFVIRTVALMLILIVSPLAFVAAILDKTKNYWNTWFQKLVRFSFVAPIYLLILTAVLAIINRSVIDTVLSPLYKSNSGPAWKGNEFVDALAYVGVSDYSFEYYSGVFMFFALVIGLLIASHIVSQQIAGNAASLATKYAGRVTGAAAGVAAFAGRNTAGRYGYKYYEENKKRLEEEARQEGWKGYAARAKLRTSKAMSGYSYDVRSDKAGMIGRVAQAPARAASAALGAVGARPDVGRPSREAAKGYAGIQDEKLKEILKKSGEREGMSKEAREALAQDVARGITLAAPALLTSKTTRKRAAEKLRKGKSDEEKLAELAAKVEKEKRAQKGEEEEGEKKPPHEEPRQEESGGTQTT